jgi:hypothetical protein
LAYGDEGTVVAAPVAVAGDVVTVVEVAEADGHKNRFNRTFFIF